MNPKNRKEILDTCQNNFWNYSMLSKIMIIISIVLSAAAVVYYIGGYIIPTIQGITHGDIAGWNIVWKVFLGFILYYVLHFVNIICVSIGGSAVCREENWDTFEFSKAWMNIYKYEKYLNDITNEKTEE